MTDAEAWNELPAVTEAPQPKPKTPRKPRPSEIAKKAAKVAKSKPKTKKR